MIPRIQQNTVGAPIAVKIKSEGTFDAAGLTLLEIHVRGRNGDTWVLPAAWRGDPNDGVLERILEPGDLPQYGLHAIQGYASGGGREIRTRVLDLEVESNLTPPPIILRAEPLSVSAAAPIALN